ncbi:MAG: methylenetetrahydrofolate reductase [Bifidobacteriaceae bacterium]|jgi:methylenetetrahydrofolate reductase (NADPH)|nr:methylenetetrahydrofolate reductase [Bifidobacteriaceae bacterium]
MPRNWTLSFEVMPPRNPQTAPKFWHNVDELVKLRPQFLSVTYGAAGKNRGTALDVAIKIVKDTPITPLAHLTSADMAKEDVEKVVDKFLQHGIRMFLALRGDPQTVDTERKVPVGTKMVESASELTYLIRSHDRRNQRLNASEKFKSIARPLVIAVAAFPDGNPELRTNQDQEIERLLEKQDAGADFAITQLFYDSKVFDSFMQKSRKRGVTLPIIAGIMPTWEPHRLNRSFENIGIRPSEQLLRDLNNADNDELRENIGLQFFQNLSSHALQSGATGLHFFTFNNSEPSVELLKTMSS